LALPGAVFEGALDPRETPLLFTLHGSRKYGHERRCGVIFGIRDSGISLWI